MATPCAWIISTEETQPLAQAAAAQLGGYGLAAKGQRWPTDQAQAWLASAEEAAQAQAGIVLVVLTPTLYERPDVRRALALFRLSLQTRLGRWVNGLVLSGSTDTTPADERIGILDDWQPVQDARWPARAVARAHAPVAPHWPAQLGLHAHERLGIWLEAHPAPGATADGALVGVSGNDASISFHATGPAGRLPERTVNEYALEGLQFEAGGAAFHAWALQNRLAPDDRYYVRLEGEPDLLAVGTLPDGQPDGVCLIPLR